MVMFGTKMRYPLGLRLMRVRQRTLEQTRDDDTVLRPVTPLKLHRSGWVRRMMRRD